MPEEKKTTDEERLCPACRSEISIWATKCKFCGSEVGRPRMREARLTLKDLGGESENTHRVSKHVMGAIGAFRYDEVYAKDAEKNEGDAEHSRGGAHPQQGDARPQGAITKIFLVVVVIAIALGALYFIGGYTPQDLQEYFGKLTGRATR